MGDSAHALQITQNWVIVSTTNVDSKLVRLLRIFSVLLNLHDWVIALV